MMIVDANVLIYAYDDSSPAHDAARTWLEAAMNGEEEVRFAVVTLLAFARITTSPAVFRTPLPTAYALEIVGSWLERPNVALAQPSERHWTILGEVAEGGQARGGLVMDAHLAALALEHGATLITTDRDFARFAGLRTRNPLAA
jgi:toxin-antitoxin system PIN domain toxin